MTPEQRREYARDWRSAHPHYYRDYYREHRERYRDYAARSRQAVKDRPCKVEGCAEPRYVTPAGYVDSRCRTHAAAQARQHYQAKRAAAADLRPAGVKPYIPRRIPAAERPCLGPYAWTADGAVQPSYQPCSRPRFIRWDGKVDPRCAEHALEDLGDMTTPEFATIDRQLRRQAGRCACCRRKLRPSSSHLDRDAVICYRCQRLLELDTAAIAEYLSGRQRRAAA